MTPEEIDALNDDEKAERDSWREYCPEIALAITTGYLDDEIGELMSALIKRRESARIKTTVKVPRKTSAPLVNPPNPHVSAYGGPVLPGVLAGVDAAVDAATYSRYANSPNYVVTRRGLVSKMSLNNAGSQLIGAGLYFPLKNSRSYRDTTWKIVKLRRTKALLEGMSGRGSGRQLLADMAWVADSMHEYTEGVNTDGLYALNQ